MISAAQYASELYDVNDFLNSEQKGGSLAAADLNKQQNELKIIKEEGSSKKSLELGFVQQPFQDSNLGAKNQKCAAMKNEGVPQSSQMSKKRKANPA